MAQFYSANLAEFGENDAFRFVLFGNRTKLNAYA